MSSFHLWSIKLCSTVNGKLLFVFLNTYSELMVIYRVSREEVAKLLEVLIRRF